jgi:hypothetical protein
MKSLSFSPMTSRTALPPRGDDNAPHTVDADALARFVERFAVVLTEAGWPRMPARVFACLLADERGELTARELVDRLTVSPAAISGAGRRLEESRAFFAFLRGELPRIMERWRTQQARG